MDASPTTPDESVPSPLLEQLLAVHSARETSWLADAAGTAAERGLGALYSLLYVLDACGELKGEPPASGARSRGLARIYEALDIDIATAKFDPQENEHVAAALRDGRAVFVDELAQALPGSPDAEKVRRLGVAGVLLAPLYWGGESLGVLVLLMPDGSNRPLKRAELLGHHVAVALRNLRENEAGRKRSELDAVRWVYDERRMREQLTQEARRARRHGRPLSILLLRVPNLEELREQFGRFLADQLLRQLAGQLDDATRDTDFLGASGEDGLTAILIETDESGAEQAKRRLLNGLVAIRLQHTDLPGLRFEFVCGTASLPQDGSTADELAAAVEARLVPPPEQAAAASAG